ncbi:MAG: hypothetical protein KH230_12060 [Enterocloster asparagiformis]|nr:hypothetical protein [Enterocloster asparagiformis]
MEEEPRQRPGIVYGLLLLFLPPLGIYLIWRDRKFSRIARRLLSLFFGLAFAGALLLAASWCVQEARAKEAASGTARAGADGQSEAADEETDFVYEAETGEVRTDRYIYQGRVRDGKPYGEGTFFLADGERITGPVDDDTVSGQAVCEYADGARYIGMVTRNVPDGQGVYRTPGKDTVEGLWRDGVPTGRVKVSYRCGDTYEGEIQDGKKSGQGRITYANGDVYEGAWENDLYSGTGKYTFRDSRSYDGQWREGLLDGEAVYRDAEGNVFVGTWEAGNCVKLEEVDPGEG